MKHPPKKYLIKKLLINHISHLDIPLEVQGPNVRIVVSVSEPDRIMFSRAMTKF